MPKLPAVRQRPGQLSSPVVSSRENAEAFARAFEVFGEAGDLLERLAGPLSERTPDPVKQEKIFRKFAAVMRDTQQLFAPAAAVARAALGKPQSMAGLAGKTADGSSVRVGLDGVVQATAPDDILRELGIKPSTPPQRVSPAKRRTRGASKGL